MAHRVSDTQNLVYGRVPGVRSNSRRLWQMLHATADKECQDDAEHRPCGSLHYSLPQNDLSSVCLATSISRGSSAVGSPFSAHSGGKGRH